MVEDIDLSVQMHRMLAAVLQASSFHRYQLQPALQPGEAGGAAEQQQQRAPAGAAAAGGSKYYSAAQLVAVAHYVSRIGHSNSMALKRILRRLHGDLPALDARLLAVLTAACGRVRLADPVALQALAAAAAARMPQMDARQVVAVALAHTRLGHVPEGLMQAVGRYAESQGLDEFGAAGTLKLAMALSKWRGADPQLLSAVAQRLGNLRRELSAGQQALLERTKLLETLQESMLGKMVPGVLPGA